MDTVPFAPSSPLAGSLSSSASSNNIGNDNTNNSHDMSISSASTSVGGASISSKKNSKSNNKSKSKNKNKNRSAMRYTQESLPPKVRKYWRLRYSLFSRFDEGIRMNTELWYSVTPEAIAVFVARFVRCCLPHASAVLDLFSGGGGNTIQFASLFDMCVAIDYNDDNISCAEHNAHIYEVHEKTHFIHADWKKMSYNPEQIEKLKLEFQIDVAFSSPPWGGPDYKRYKHYNLRNLQPFPLDQLLASLYQITDHIVLFLPKNSNVRQLSKVTTKIMGPDAMVRVVHVKANGYEKGLLCFWGRSFMTEEMLQGASGDAHFSSDEIENIEDNDFYIGRVELDGEEANEDEANEDEANEDENNEDENNEDENNEDENNEDENNEDENNEDENNEDENNEGENNEGENNEGGNNEDGMKRA